MLKTPVLYHKKEHVDNLFFTCCALHNQLHAWDQRGEWENGMEWGAKDGLFDDDEVDANYAMPMIRDVRAGGSRATPRRAEASDDFSCIGLANFRSSVGVLFGSPATDPNELSLDTLVSLHTESDGVGFDELQRKLVANFTWKKAHKQLNWMR